jgi:hypothetical protein
MTPSLPPAWLSVDRLAWAMTRQGYDLETAMDCCERAAVYEYDAGMSREAAERQALADIKKAPLRAGRGL